MIFMLSFLIKVDGINHSSMYGSYATKSRFQVAVVVALNIYQRDGLRGFYRGYTASLFTSSALWWAFYHLYHGISFQASF